MQQEAAFALQSDRENVLHVSVTYEREKTKLKAIPDWQERLRLFVDELIQESLQNGKT